MKNSHRSWDILSQAVPVASRTISTLPSMFNVQRPMFRLLFILLVLLFLLLTSRLQAISDSNRNSVSDLWEKFYNSGSLYTNFNPTADPDGDGWTNLQEAAVGTDPRSSNPLTGQVRPIITHIPAVYYTPEEEGGEPEIITPEVITLTWPTLAGEKYTLFFSPNLTSGSWVQIGEPRIGAGTEIGTGVPLTQPDGTTPAAGFWRVTIADIDTDSDTLTNALTFIHKSADFAKTVCIIILENQ